MALNFKSKSIAVAGKVDQRPKTSNVKLNRKATPNFNLIYHPKRWDWAGKEYGWLPDLGKQYLTEGVNGYTIKDGLMYVKNNLECNDNVIIPISELPEEYHDMVVSYDTRYGKTYDFKWVSYKALDSVSAPKTVTDFDMKYRTLKSLADNVLPSIDLDVVDWLTDKMRDQLIDLKNKYSLQNTVSRSMKIQKLETRIKEIEEYHAISIPPQEEEKKLKSKGV